MPSEMKTLILAFITMFWVVDIDVFIPGFTVLTERCPPHLGGTLRRLNVCPVTENLVGICKTQVSQSSDVSSSILKHHDDGSIVYASAHSIPKSPGGHS